MDHNKARKLCDSWLPARTSGKDSVERLLTIARTTLAIMSILRALRGSVVNIFGNQTITENTEVALRLIRGQE